MRAEVEEAVKRSDSFTQVLSFNLAHYTAKGSGTNKGLERLGCIRRGRSSSQIQASVSDGIPTCWVLFMDRSALYAVLVRRNLRCLKSMSFPQNTDPSEAGAKASLVQKLFRPLLIFAIVVALIQALLPNWTQVSTWALTDNDDAMRVLQVRDWLAGQSWYDVSQHRLTPHPYSNIHWSRIADLPLAATMLLTTSVLGQALGEKIAVFITPVWLGVLYVVIGAKAATALGGKKALVPAALLVAGAPAALGYFMPGRVDHHGLQLILLVTTLFGLLSGGGRKAGLAGLAMALAIGIGLESLPLQIVVIGWVALRWAFRGDDVASETRWFAASFALSLVVCFAATVMPSKWALPVNDAIGRGHVVLGFIGGSLLALATFLPVASSIPSRTMIIRLSTLVLIALVLVVGLKFFPELLVPPYSQIDPLLTRLWLDNVSETKPLWNGKLSTVLAFAVFPVLAAIASTIAIVWAKGRERDLWALAALTIFVSLGLAVFWQSRVSGLASAVSGVMAAALIGKLAEQISFKVAFMTAIILNPIVPGLIGSRIAKSFEPKSAQFKTGGGAACYTERAFSTLRAQSSGLVIAPIDMGARILLVTPHRVLAGPYHRNNAGNLAAYRLFKAQPNDAKRMARELGASYLAICTKSAEVAILSREAPKGLMAELRDGRIPAWLTPIEKPKGANVEAFRVNLD
jgi:hypothetical protein